MNVFTTSNHMHTQNTLMIYMLITMSWLQLSAHLSQNITMYPINLGKNSVNMNLDKGKKLMFGKSSKIVHGNLGHYFCSISISLKWFCNKRSNAFTDSGDRKGQREARLAEPPPLKWDVDAWELSICLLLLWIHGLCLQYKVKIGKWGCVICVSNFLYPTSQCHQV